jgi:DNA-binding transcriptional MerR regulator
MKIEPDRDAPPDEDEWRIDDLAQRAGVTVDTIRYYQREGLLAAGERVGRSLRYGPEHLERLERIRALQARRFSLAAIHALLEHEGPIDSLFAPLDGTPYDRAALVEVTGASDAFVESLEGARFLGSPSELGREAYDTDDREVLRAFLDLADLGVPDDVLVTMGALVTDRAEQVLREIGALFMDPTTPGWDAESHARFERGRIEEPARLVRAIRAILSYAEQRSSQRVVLAKLLRADEHPHD